MTVRMANEGSQTTCFFEKDKKKMIKFKNDHIFASQDVIAIKVDLSVFEK